MRLKGEIFLIFCFQLVWFSHWCGIIQSKRLPPAAFWEVFFVKRSLLFHSAKETNQFEMILLSQRKGTTSLFSRLCIFSNCKTYSTIEGIIICTCQSILTYYSMVMAFYIKSGGLKALPKMKGTHSRQSTIHVIRLLESRCRRKGYTNIWSFTGIKELFKDICKIFRIWHFASLFVLIPDTCRIPFMKWLDSVYTKSC